MMKNGHLFLSLLLICYNNPAWADSYTDIENKYPSDTYIVGIAEAESSGNIYNDKTRVEILARLEIAKQIRVRIKEESLDIMCEGAGKTAFAGMEECRNQLSTVIETTVDELLRDSQIVESGEDKDRGIYYAVAILSKYSPPFRKGGKGGFEQQEKIPSPSGRGEVPVPSTTLRTDLREVEGVRVGPTVEDVNVVTAEGKIVLGDDTTPARARAIAMNNARRTALEEAVGVNLHGSSVIYNSELVRDLVITATKGIIVKQDILEDRCYTEEDRIYCLVRIEAHVKPLSQADSKRVKILKASIRRPDKNVSENSPVFQDGDEIQIKVAASDNVFINIFRIDHYGNVIKLYPNNYIKAEIIPSGKEFIFPDDTIRSQGLNLRVTTPKGMKSGIESVLIIATKEEGFFLTDPSIQNPTISDLMNELSRLDPAAWTEKTIGYEVVK